MNSRETLAFLGKAASAQLARRSWGAPNRDAPVNVAVFPWSAVCFSCPHWPSGLVGHGRGGYRVATALCARSRTKPASRGCRPGTLRVHGQGQSHAGLAHTRRRALGRDHSTNSRFRTCELVVSPLK